MFRPEVVVPSPTEIISPLTSHFQVLYGENYSPAEQSVFHQFREETVLNAVATHGMGRELLERLNVVWFLQNMTEREYGKTPPVSISRLFASVPEVNIFGLPSGAMGLCVLDIASVIIPDERNNATMNVRVVSLNAETMSVVGDARYGQLPHGNAKLTQYKLDGVRQFPQLVSQRKILGMQLILPALINTGLDSARQEAQRLGDPTVPKEQVIAFLARPRHYSA